MDPGTVSDSLDNLLSPEILSRRKLAYAAESLQKSSSSQLVVRCHPCETTEDTVGYRCRCSFQCVWEEDGGEKMQYAIRRNQRAEVVDCFPIANLRIHCAMLLLQEQLNERRHELAALCLNLTSVSFSASWNEGPDSDCLVTLHYALPIEDTSAWKQQASWFIEHGGFSQMTGRSRKRVLRAVDAESANCIRDTVWLARRQSLWTASLARPNDEDASVVKVLYEKPEVAFSHPNARVMCHALGWILNRLALVASRRRENGVESTTLLELYCGGGAHTMAINQACVVDKIVAVEYDDRLVEAFRQNMALNDRETQDEPSSTSLEVVLADAGSWARKQQLSLDFDVLLVDPPKQGLDERVCAMARNGGFTDLLYISCGRDALARDLGRLSDSFEVVDCQLLDLFPQTEAVESLVHMRRRTP